MESLKPKVQAVQDCQSALRIPEEVVTSLPMCHSALRLQEEASRLQHTAIQQCNIMQASATPSQHHSEELQQIHTDDIQIAGKTQDFISLGILLFCSTIRDFPTKSQLFLTLILMTMLIVDLFIRLSPQFLPDIAMIFVMLLGLTKQTANIQLYSG